MTPQATVPTPAVTLVPTRAPAQAVDPAPFLRAGCTRIEDLDTTLRCDRALPPHACAYVGSATVDLDPLLAPLSAIVPVARCRESARSFGTPPPPASDMPRFRGGLGGPGVEVFVAVEGGKLRVMRSRKDFSSRFAPVRTEEQALAFAVALGGGWANFDPLGPTTADLGMLTPLAPRIEGTAAVRTPDGFHVNLFAGDGFGCGEKTTHAVDVTVSLAGDVTAVNGDPLWVERAGRCAD